MDPNLLPEGSKVIRNNNKNSVIVTSSTKVNRSFNEINSNPKKKKIAGKSNYSDPNQNVSNIDKILDTINQPIIIQTLTRPFSILIKGLELEFTNKAKDLKKQNKKKNISEDEKLTTVLIKIQIICGSQAFSKPKMIKWRGSNDDKFPVINRRIYFDLTYSKLPMFSSILFKVKKLYYNKINELIDHENLAWANFRLFDHNRRLKTGKINLQLGWT